MSYASFSRLRWTLVLVGGLLGGRLLADDSAPPAGDAVEQGVTQGALRIVQKDGGIVECPLKHTDVGADIAGFVARVRVTQTFHNPTKEKVEAVRSEERRVGKECRCRRGPYVEKREGQK